MTKRKSHRNPAINHILFDYVDQFVSGDDFTKKPSARALWDIADRAYDGAGDNIGYVDWSQADYEAFCLWYESADFDAIVARVRRVFNSHPWTR